MCYSLCYNAPTMLPAGSLEAPLPVCRMRLRRIRQRMQHTQGDTKERELLKCVVAVKECIRGGGRHLQDVIFKHR